MEKTRKIITMVRRSDSYSDTDAGSGSGSDSGRLKQCIASIQVQSAMTRSLFNASPFQPVTNCS